MKRGLVMVVAGAALSSVLALPGLAAHTSNNRFDLRDLTGAGADGKGVSNYIAGQDRSQGEEVWNSHVRVSGLAPGTYTLWAENANDTFEPAVDTAICSFTVTENGNGGCHNNHHAEPALAFARIRTGDGTSAAPVFGAKVLEASGAAGNDPDNKVQDGQIERTKNRDA